MTSKMAAQDGKIWRALKEDYILEAAPFKTRVGDNDDDDIRKYSHETEQVPRDVDVEQNNIISRMDTPQALKNDSPSRTRTRSISNSPYSENKYEVRKKLMMMEAAMPAVLAWNMFQICQSDGISPAAAAQKIFQLDVRSSSDDEDHSDESCLAVLQKLEDLIYYQRKLRMEFEKAEELSEFRERQLRKKVIDLETKASRNRRLFDDLISDLMLRRKDSSNDLSPESISSHDVMAFEEVQKLAEDEVILKKRIEELEEKENMYLKTLEQADELWLALKSKTG